jgi:hypothetical protein
MTKKRKLNSTNPKYNIDTKEQKKHKRVLMKENKLFKMYFLYEL